MGVPVTVTIPHQLGQSEAKSRIGGGIDKLGEFIPGATLRNHHWEDDNLHFTLEAMGQNVASELQVRDDEVYAIIDLPPMLAMFAQKIKEALHKSGPKLLK